MEMVMWLVLATFEMMQVQPVLLSSQALSVVVDPKGFFYVTEKRTKLTWRSVQHIAPFRNLRKLAEGKVSFQTDARQRDGKTFPVTVTVWLEGDELVMEASVDKLEMRVGTFSFSPPFPPISPNSDLLVPFYGNGIAVPVESKEFRGWSFTTYGALDMPWVGVTDGKAGYLLLWDGRSADDGLCVLETVKISGSELIVPSAYHDPTIGTFGYQRRIRYFFVPDGGYVALCKRYRDYARRKGFLVTLAEKAKRKPDVKLLAGAPNVWGGNPQFAKEAKSEGIDRLLINGIWSAEQMETIKALGYLNSRYDNYEDLYTCCPNHNPPYNIGTIDDCVLRADGNRQVGWVTWDKKHTSHKRCSILQLDVARSYITDQLKRHPHNAWFLDVTTATGLIECYDPKHPHNRTEDREAKRRLAKFVGEELGLVLGGEHGRWWGVDIYDYWEGMMSHNAFFTWPAGHLRPPEKREEIGERYLEWGLGHRRRLPLWELVFHDCVVSYWYWGDSTDFLYRVAPDLSDKKDAFNILYGTPPMFWVNRLGFTWSDPALRKRLLQSYRLVCKLHEQIAFDEMLSHEWLTPDRSVQRTIFGKSGERKGTTEVIVNFGEKQFALERLGRKFALPQYGFFVHGPSVTQYRIAADERTVTFVKTRDFNYCDAGGKVYDFGNVITDGEVTMKREGLEQIRIWLGVGTNELSMRVSEFPDIDFASARLILLSEDGKAREVVKLKLEGRGKNRLAKVPSLDWQQALLVWGKSSRKPNFTVNKVTVTPAQPKQGEGVKVTVVVVNNGLASGTAKVSLFLDRISPDRLLAEQTVQLPADSQKQISFSIGTEGIDGTHNLLALLEAVKPKDELVATDNRREATFTVTADYSHWRYKFEIIVDAAGVRRLDEPVTFEVDWCELAGVSPKAIVDPDSVRVVEIGRDGKPERPVPCSFTPTEPGNRKGTVTFLLTGETPPNGKRRFWVLAVEKQGSKRVFFPPKSELRWDNETSTVTTPFYRLRFGEDRMVREWVSLMPGAPEQSFLRSLGVSSAQTGWVDEIGEVESFECLSINPVNVVIRVVKQLRGDFRIVKTFTFYPRHFVVEVEANKPGIREYSRAFYLLEGKFEDDKGNRAVVDGKGEGENVIGKNAHPKWYAVYSNEWAHSCVALSRFDNLTYWDVEGARGGIAFNTGETKGIRLVYALHGGQKDASFAAWDYERFTKPPTIAISESQGKR